MTTHATMHKTVTQPEAGATVPELTRPHVVERYWGYEVSKACEELNAAVIVRWTAALSCVGIFLFVWFGLPVANGVLPTQSAASRTIMTLVLLLVAVPLFRAALQSTDVRVQIDTATGELREVVTGLLGADVVLGRYGLDTIEGIAVAVSKSDPMFGQVQIALRDGEVVAAGSRSLTALRSLRDRLVVDCGITRRENGRKAEWSGPIMA